MLQRESLPSMGQMSPFALSLVSILPEDPFVCSSRDCRESSGRNPHDQLLTDNADKPLCNRKRLGSLFTPKRCAELSNHAKNTHSSLPCLLSEIHSSKRTVAMCTNFKYKQGNKKTLQSAQASSIDNNYQDKRLCKMPSNTCNQFNSMELPIHKDGKFGWIIVFGAFLINMIIDGICLSFGIFYSEFLDYFGEGQSKTAWTGSVLSGTYSLLGKQFEITQNLNIPLHHQHEE